MPNTHPLHEANETPEDVADAQLQLFERQLSRYGRDGDCAYERALGRHYLKLFEQRRCELDALRRAGL